MVKAPGSAAALRHPHGVLTLREQRWERILLFLVKGDIVALAAETRHLGMWRAFGSLDHPAVEILRRLRFAVATGFNLSPSHSGIRSSCQQLPPDSDAFLALCGDLALYRMLEMPLQTLADQIPRRMLPPAPLFALSSTTSPCSGEGAQCTLGIVVLAGVASSRHGRPKAVGFFFF